MELLNYNELFASQEPRRTQIIRAASRLGLMLNKEIKAEVLEGWAQRLSQFSTGQLVTGFSLAEGTLETWPTPAKVIHLIFDSEWPADYAWLLAKLTTHHPEWRDRGPVYGEIYRNPDLTSMEPYLRNEIESAQSAPEMPARLRVALEIFGAGSITQGLTLLYKHPNCERIDYDAIETLRVKRQIDDGFRAAWTQARMRELA